MTDRVKGFVVVLDHDIREDDVAPLRAAIECLRGVLKTSMVKESVDDYINREQARAELARRLWGALHDD